MLHMEKRIFLVDCLCRQRIRRGEAILAFCQFLKFRLAVLCRLSSIDWHRVHDENRHLAAYERADVKRAALQKHVQDNLTVRWQMSANSPGEGVGD